MNPRLFSSIFLILVTFAMTVHCEDWKWMEYVNSKLSEISENLPEYTANFMETAKKHGDHLQKTLKDYANEVQNNYEVSILQDFVENLPEHTANFMLTKAITGATVGACHNAANYIIKDGERWSNILNIFYKKVVNSYGYPRWYARIDRPHTNFDSYHINVNPKVTGVPDPHIRIFGITAHGAGWMGRGLNLINKVAPVAMAASVAYDAKDVWDDYSDGKREEAMRKGVSKVSTYVVASFGANIGAAIGSWIFPGVGTLLGGLLGGVVGGIGGGVGGEVLAVVFNL